MSDNGNSNNGNANGNSNGNSGNNGNNGNSGDNGNNGNNGNTDDTCLELTSGGNSNNRVEFFSMDGHFYSFDAAKITYIEIYRSTAYDRPLVVALEMESGSKFKFYSNSRNKKCREISHIFLDNDTILYFIESLKISYQFTGF